MKLSYQLAKLVQAERKCKFICDFPRRSLTSRPLGRNVVQAERKSLTSRPLGRNVVQAERKCKFICDYPRRSLTSRPLGRNVSASRAKMQNENCKFCDFATLEHPRTSSASRTSSPPLAPQQKILFKWKIILIFANDERATTHATSARPPRPARPTQGGACCCTTTTSNQVN